MPVTRGRVGGRGAGGGWGGVGGKPKAGPPFHWDTDSGAVCPVGDRDVHNPQDRSRRTLAADWYPKNPNWCSPVAPQDL